MSPNPKEDVMGRARRGGTPLTEEGGIPQGFPLLSTSGVGPAQAGLYTSINTPS